MAAGGVWGHACYQGKIMEFDLSSANREVAVVGSLAPC
jgi:hypothetical protein